MRRHGFDPLSFAFGLLFVVLATMMSAGPFDFEAPGLRWLAAGFLLLLGILMIATSRAGSRDRT